MVNENLCAIDPAANETRRIDTEAKVGAKAELDVGRRLERLHTPILEHARFAVTAIFPVPDVQVFIMVTPAVILHADAQFIGKPRVVLPTDRQQDSAWRWRLAAEHSVDWVSFEIGIPCEPQFRPRSADRRH